jgi:hypothetical protein
MIVLITVMACSGSAEGALEGAIEAANDNDVEGFLDHLDEQSSAFFRVGLADSEKLSGDWVVLHGDPVELLRGAVPIQYVDLGGGIVRATIEKDEEERTVWILKTGGGNSSSWKVHLLSRDHLFHATRVEAQ